jgi:hypothetical protein
MKFCIASASVLCSPSHPILQCPIDGSILAVVKTRATGFEEFVSMIPKDWAGSCIMSIRVYLFLR